MFEMYRFLKGELAEDGKKTLRIYSFLSMLSPIMDLFSFSMILYIMNRVISEGHASKQLIALTVGMTFVSVVKGAFELFRCLVSNRLIYRGAQALSEKMYALINRETLKEHNGRDEMQTLAAVRSDPATSVGIITNSISIIISAIMILIYFTVLIVVSGWIGALTDIMMVVFMLFVFLYQRRQIVELGSKTRSLGIKMNGAVTTAYGAFKEVKIDRRSQKLENKYRETGKDYVSVNETYSFRRAVITVTMQDCIMVFIYLVLAILMIFDVTPTAMMESLIVFVTVLIKMLPMERGLVSRLNELEHSRKVFEIFRENLERYDGIMEQEKAEAELEPAALTFNKGLTVKDLTFGYRSDRLIFDRASIEIPAGRSVAVIGPSGSGKTTFLDLILGLLTPSEGQVFYDDFDIVSSTRGGKKYRTSVGDIVSYIPQTVYLNGETVRNNVAFFADEENIDDERVENCLKCAQIWEDVQEMEDGVNSLIGSGGQLISGGQRQRIGLARALYKDFEILVMDEATAALDMETEKAVIDSIRCVKGDKTLLMVTHHMSLANECDIVYRLENKGFVRVR